MSLYPLSKIAMCAVTNRDEDVKLVILDESITIRISTDLNGNHETVEKNEKLIGVVDNHLGGKSC
ncbi:MAG: hypothetical protein H7235_02650 [Bdellovibrionaceae bacterium]|nr:hypothetical protein [Pseudobdellovibrionaceae bacterium]